jgi:hypothetical protein
LRRVASYAQLAAPLAVVAVGVWIISPRFSITGPSLIDDWDALLSAPSLMHEIVRFNYPAGQRFFPTLVLWNWLQWRVPGAPEQMVGPNLMDVARLALLVGGLTALTWLLLPWRSGHRLERLVLSALPGLVVVTVPAFAQDLARFGPAEPALVGGLTLGAALMVWGGRELASETMAPKIGAWLLIVAGWVLWCYGAGQKETCVCLLLLFGLAIPFGWGVWRRSSRRQLEVLAGLLAAALVPILVVLYEVVRIVQRGTLVYGAHVKTGSGSISVLSHAFHVMHPSTQSVAGFVLLALAVMGFALPPRPLRIDWIQVAIVVVGLASLEMSVQSGAYESRYYLPTIALWAVGSARTVARFPARVRQGAVAAGAALCLASAVPAHSLVSDWAAGDQQGDELVSAVKAHTHDGCRLRIAGVDYERTRSIAALVSYPDGPSNCAGVKRYAVVAGLDKTLLQETCASGRGTPLGSWTVGEHVYLVRCVPG